MRNHIFAAVAFTTTTPVISADLGALGGLGEPGFYGQIDIHRAPKPEVMFPEPMAVRQADVGTPGEPAYMRVPADHAKNWRKHGQKYNPCDQRVFFVDDKWYTNVYAPAYRKGTAEKP
jgi:hypothetical protein